MIKKRAPDAGDTCSLRRVPSTPGAATIKKRRRSFFASFRDAFDGIQVIARRERNFRVQIILGILAILACIIFQILGVFDALLFILVGFAVFFVLAMELVNTAVEAIIDMISGGKSHPLAKIAKDAAAGAVLLASVFAIIVAVAVAASVIGRFLE
ncbi:MAG: diacylglycerol kinase family protein [Defluviitaleaceae bacterium]|nr:diacylglycerol kinase family protein [Defluviitaleaceae bacterium]